MQRLNTFQEAGSERLEIGPGMELAQTFVSTRDNLSSVRMPVYNPNLGAQGRYLLRLWQGETALRELSLTESNLGWADVLRFDFAPIANSAGQEYRISFASLDASEAAGEKETFVALAVSSSDSLPGELTFNQQAQVGDLRFASYYQVSIGRWPMHVVEDLSYRLWQRPGFLFLYCSVIIGLIVGVIRLRNNHNLGRIRS